MSKRLRKPAIVVAVAVLAGLLLDRYLIGGADFEEIYRVVLGRVVFNRGAELTAVALADVDQWPPPDEGSDDRKLLPLPPRLQTWLNAEWALKRLSKEIVPVSRVRPIHGEIEKFGTKMRTFERYVDSETGKVVRVFRIDSVRWIGKSEVLVQWSGTAASLDANGSTIRLKKFFGFWRVVKVSHEWIS